MQAEYRFLYTGIKGIKHCLQQRGNQFKHRDPLLAHSAPKETRIMSNLIRKDTDATTNEQGSQKLPDRDIKTGRCRLSYGIR